MSSEQRRLNILPSSHSDNQPTKPTIEPFSHTSSGVANRAPKRKPATQAKIISFRFPFLEMLTWGISQLKIVHHLHLKALGFLFTADFYAVAVSYTHTHTHTHIHTHISTVHKYIHGCCR